MKRLNEQIIPKFSNQAKKLDQYTLILRKVLPIECYEHVQVANIKQQSLMLITDSPVWTTRLRQLSPTILKFLRENSVDAGQVIHHVQISTRYHNNATDEQRQHGVKKRAIPKISKKTSELLSQSASSIDHQPLKDALLRVASHISKEKK